MRKALITGGSRGIGYAAVELFRAKGYEVCAPVRQELDLSSVDSVERFVEKYRQTRFDVLVNNAGINEINLMEDIQESELRDTFLINLESPIRLLRGFIPAMKANGYGRIVNIGSIWSVVSKPGRSLYSATKNAMHGITNTLALELASYNILVNTLCPGFTRTELTKKNNSPEQIAQIEKDIPLQRMAEPIEIARMIYFLASEENTYITGQRICIDGGFTVK
jgi:3-oxoacyl-[acyl-carrier protein] reductase